MTMLEALVALVILGASAAGFLGVFQNGARSMQSASEWNRATAVAEAALEESVRARIAGADADQRLQEDSGIQTRIEAQPWSDRVDDVIVRVTLPDGRSMTVHRLVRRR
jgi:type II secretory pathway pseudopilin PulG